MFRPIVLLFLTIITFTFLGCASSAPVATAETERGYDRLPADFRIRTEDIRVVKMDDAPSPVPCGSTLSKERYRYIKCDVWSYPYATKYEVEYGTSEEEFWLRWKGDCVHARTVADPVLVTGCEFHVAAACDKMEPEGDNGCVDFAQCCTLGSPTISSAGE